MHRSFLEYLADPQTHQPLQLDVEEERNGCVVRGTLRSPVNEYPIVNGIPRFAGESSTNYAKSFGYQWNKWKKVQFESENIGRPMEGHTRNMWEKITGISESLDGQVVLDIGSGPGRFSDIARKKGARVISVDYSSAVEAAAANFDGDTGICVCQADALNLPIRAASMSGAFSIGVLHHTPRPEQGVREAVRVLEPGGWFGLSVYAKGGGYDARMINYWRKFFNVLWPCFKHYPPLMYSYFSVYALRPVHMIPLLGKLARFFFPSATHLPDRRWALLDTFDSVTPSYQSAHETYEVYQWLKRSGLNDIAPTPWGSTSFRGCVPDK